jgi:hypothetical protein
MGASITNNRVALPGVMRKIIALCSAITDTIYFNLIALFYIKPIFFTRDNIPTLNSTTDFNSIALFTQN